MRTQHFLSTLVIGASLVGGLAAAPAFAQSANPAASTEARQGLSIGQVHDKLTAAGYTRIDKIERERNDFEVKATDKNGKRVKLRVDPRTGVVIEARQKNDRDDDRRDEKRDRRSADDSDAK